MNYNPYFRYYGNGVTGFDYAGLVEPGFRPSLRARLLGAGKPIVRLPALPEQEGENNAR